MAGTNTGRLRDPVTRFLTPALLIMALYCAAYAQVSTLEAHRNWATAAAFGYVAAALGWLIARRPAVPVAIAAFFAVLFPAGLLLQRGMATPEIAVVQDAADRLLHTGRPYAARPASLDEVNPYLPVMALFGLPAALAGRTFWTDPRLFIATITVAAIASAWLLLRPADGGAAIPGRGWWLPTVLALVSPLGAIALTLSGVDLPVVAAGVLGLALMATDRRRAGAVVLALGCAVKWTCWPIAAVALAMAVARGGRRAGLRLAAATAVGAVALCLPALLADPGALVRDTLLFPVGAAGIATPAGDSLLTALFPAAGWLPPLAMAVVASALLAFVWRRPPRTFAAGAQLAAGGLSLLFLIAPQSRPGYFVIPLALLAVAWSGRLLLGGGASRTDSDRAFVRKWLLVAGTAAGPRVE